MSWLFSRALVEEFSEGTCSAGAPFAPSSGSPTPQAYLPPDRMTAFSRPSRFGMTFSPLTVDRGEALLTSYLAAFRARTSASQAREPASTAPAVECGDTWRGSLARFDPVTSSWRTAQRSLLADSDESSVTWPRSGMTVAGQCWELPTLEHRISGTGSGCVPNGETFWRTPTAHEWKNTGHATQIHLSDQVRPSQVKNPKKAAAMWPTPTASQARSEGMILQMRSLVDAGVLDRSEAEAMISGSLTPPRMEKWPTPTVCGNYNRKGLSERSGDGLATAVMKWPTPRSRDWKDTGSVPPSRVTNPQLATLGQATAMTTPGGSLNPTWVEWLMGWPLGWTDLKPSATDKSHSALQQRGDC